MFTPLICKRRERAVHVPVCVCVSAFSTLSLVLFGETHVTCPWIWQKKPVRRRYEPYGMYSDDDANSDASSVCSERSYSSRNGGVPHYLRQTEDVAEVLNHCASSNWSERKEGLLGLQNLLKSQRTLR